MSDTQDRLLREEGFAFCGTINASLSHEITNVFATINELAGLLDDFFVASRQGTPLDVERLAGTTQRIAAQVERGRRYVKRLNTFAHTVDDRQSAVRVNENVEAMVTLCGRLAKLRRVELETHLPETSPEVRGRPFDLQHIIFRCIDVLLTTSKEGDVVQVRVESEGERGRLVFEGRSPLDAGTETASKHALLDVLTRAYHCETEATIQPGQPVRLSVSLPRSLSGEGEKP